MNLITRGYNQPQTIITRGMGWTQPAVQVVAPVPPMWEPTWAWLPWSSEKEAELGETVDAWLKVLRDDDDMMLLD